LRKEPPIVYPVCSTTGSGYPVAVETALTVDEVGVGDASFIEVELSPLTEQNFEKKIIVAVDVQIKVS
jgi:hypothetical protein